PHPPAAQEVEDLVPLQAREQGPRRGGRVAPRRLEGGGALALPFGLSRGADAEGRGGDGLVSEAHRLGFHGDLGGTLARASAATVLSAQARSGAVLGSMFD